MCFPMRWSRDGCRRRWAALARRMIWMRLRGHRYGSPRAMTPRQKSPAVTSTTRSRASRTRTPPKRPSRTAFWMNARACQAYGLLHRHTEAAQDVEPGTGFEIAGIAVIDDDRSHVAAVQQIVDTQKCVHLE